MSDLDTRPDEQVCTATNTDGAEELVLEARRVPLGKTTEVARVLPGAEIRMIGAWCFLDHYGPEELGDGAGMRVWAHPHTGLQTVSWLLEGEIEHRDGLGSLALVRPGELHIMTAGHGIVHSEMSLADRPPRLHGLQLWVALPGKSRDMAPRFDSYADLPVLHRPGFTATMLMGELAGVRSAAPTFSPLCGADAQLDAGSLTTIELNPTYEYGVFVIEGEARAESTTAHVDQLIYLGTSRSQVTLATEDGARVLIIGGKPFAEEIVMWWNFIGRTHREVVDFRAAWEQRSDRFAAVVDRSEKVMEAPPMPKVALKPRPRRRGY